MPFSTRSLCSPNNGPRLLWVSVPEISQGARNRSVAPMAGSSAGRLRPRAAKCGSRQNSSMDWTGEDANRPREAVRRARHAPQIRSTQRRHRSAPGGCQCARRPSRTVRPAPRQLRERRPLPVVCHRNRQPLVPPGGGVDAVRRHCRVNIAERAGLRSRDLRLKQVGHHRAQQRLGLRQVDVAAGALRLAPGECRPRVRRAGVGSLERQARCRQRSILPMPVAEEAAIVQLRRGQYVGCDNEFRPSSADEFWPTSRCVTGWPRPRPGPAG